MTRQKWNKVLALVLAAVLTIGLLPISAHAASVTFTDVSPSAWYYEDVTYLANKGIISGVGDNKFEPDTNVANCEMIKMVVNACFRDNYDAYEAYNYDAMRAYFGSNIYWFSFMAHYAKYHIGLLDGINIDISSYSSCCQPMSRYDMALILTNAANTEGIEATEAQKAAAQSKITDYAGIPAAYRDAAKNCYALGLLNGKNGAFAGSDNMTRAEACAVIVRLENLIISGIPTQPDDPTPTPTSGVPTVKEIGVASKAGSVASMGLYGTGWYVDDGYLNNGKPITEENVIELLHEAEKIWPAGMAWSEAGTGNNWYMQEGSITTRMLSASNLGTSLGINGNAGCGGFAAMISDYLFGRSSNNFHRVNDFGNIRPGDIIVMIDTTTGAAIHVKVAVTAPGGAYTGLNGTTASTRDGYIHCADGNVSDKVVWPNMYSAPTRESSTVNTSWLVFSRYPN